MTEQERNLGGTILAQTDALAALIAVLANTGHLHPKLFETALEGVQDKHPENPDGTGLMSTDNYKASIKTFIAAANKQL